MSFDVNGKIVLVTGASSGIGAEIAKSFALQGARVALTGRNREALGKVALSITAGYHEAGVFPFDLVGTEHISQLVKSVESHFKGTISVLVNCAGIASLGMVQDVPLKAYEDALRINFYAPLALIQAVMPAMKAQGSGQIVNISSGVGMRGLPGVSPYCVSKFALNALTESLRVELMPSGIDVLSVSPGLAETSFSSKIRSYGNMQETFTQGHKASPAEIAGKVVAASAASKRDLVLSLRTRIGYHLNYWAPALLDLLLCRSFFKNK